MGKVIGYKGTPEERYINWYSMITYKKHKEIFDPNDSWDKRILDRANYRYKKYLQEYIQ